MSSNKNEAFFFEDVKINVKIKLSALWAAVMLCFTYCDILQFYLPSMLDEVIQGNMGFMGPVTQVKMLGGAIMMSIPSVMVFLSLVLKPKVNRLINIIFGILFTLIMIVTMFMGAWVYYMYFGTIEIILTILIVWYALKWPKQE